MWVLVKLVNSLGWTSLPYAGGVLDQPDWVLEGLLKIEEISQRVKDTVDGR